MPIITDYDLNADWGWYDFTMVTALFVIFLLADIGMFTWWIIRNRVHVRVAGVIKFFLKYRTAPLTLFTGFDRRVANPIMQDALSELDDFPDNLSQETMDAIALFKDYKRTMDVYFDTNNGGANKTWPPGLVTSYEAFKEYRTSQFITPAYLNMDYPTWLIEVRNKGIDRQNYAALAGANVQGAQYPPALGAGGGGTAFQAFPGVANSTPFDPSMALLTRSGML